MKVYTNILKDIENEIQRAAEANRTITKITLTPKEWTEFWNATREMRQTHCLFNRVPDPDTFGNIRYVSYLGVRIEREDV